MLRTDIILLELSVPLLMDPAPSPLLKLQLVEQDITMITYLLHLQ